MMTSKDDGNFDATRSRVQSGGNKESGDMSAFGKREIPSKSKCTAATTTSTTTNNNRKGTTKKSSGKTKHKVIIDLSDVPQQPLILKNQLDRTRYKDNTRHRPVKQGSSKYTGVYFDKTCNKWKAQILVKGVVRSIGYYSKEADAAANYARAAFKYKTSQHGHSSYGGLDLSDIPEQPLITSQSASGYVGVKRNKARWEARIIVRGKLVTLGTFDTPIEAAGIYARAKLHLTRQNMKQHQGSSAQKQCPGHDVNLTTDHPSEESVEGEKQYVTL